MQQAMSVEDLLAQFELIKQQLADLQVIFNFISNIFLISHVLVLFFFTEQR
jgi:hypothetical protein